MAATHENAGQAVSQSRRVVKSYETSDANTALTVATPTDRTRVRRLSAVTVKYSANVSVDVSIVYKAGHGSAYETEVHEIALSTDDQGAWIPNGDFLIGHGDAIEVTAPAGGSGVTAAVTIVAEEL